VSSYFDGRAFYLNFPGVTRQNSEADHSHPSGAEFVIIIIIITTTTTTTSTYTTTTACLLQLSCHSVAVVLTLVQTKQMRINIHKRNNTKNTVKQFRN
jgi:hypothetical protein